MSRKPADTPPLRLIDIVTAVLVMSALVVFVGKALEEGGEPRSYPAPVANDAGVDPIPAEANVFRVREVELGIVPAFVGDSSAHIRSLDIYQRIRAFPGAPPRVPHGLTDEEYRETSCNLCHLRGGWVARFSTYAPVTPHPDYVSCLQCHVPQDTLVGRTFPIPGDSASCPQCHIDPDAELETFVELDWVPAAWPETNSQAMPESPHRIPHDFQMRSNCLACHSGPGAVVDLRTDHPERLNCRQCHVQAMADIELFPEPPAGPDRGEGGS